MGQFEILNLLRKHKRYWTTAEISKRKKTSKGSVTNSLRKLHNSGLIVRKRLKLRRYKYRIR